jgi:GNAT superfamily N-acetyltransferase
VIVRRATSADVPELVRLRREFHLEDGGRDELGTAFDAECKAFLGRALGDERWAIWVAEADGDVVAHVYVELVEKVPKPVRTPRRWGYVNNVYAQPERRGSGIGGELLEAVMRWAVDASLEFLIVWPSEESVAFYRRHGFEHPPDPLVLEIAPDAER